MINFLPLIYEDELFFSVISRYKQICGMGSKRALEMDLFRIYKRMGRKSVLFPQYLDTFVSNLPPTSKLSIKDIINKHTMHPFYTSFFSWEKTQLVFNAMKKGYGRSIENMVGLAGSKVKSTNYLRYCPMCFREDMEKLGESYWRRLPQVPGALYCPIHKVLYKDSKVVITDCRNDFYCADEDTCNTELMVDTNPIQFKLLNLRYLENVSYLFKQNVNRKDLTFIINFYVDRLRERGIASTGGTLYIDRLIEAFLSYYPSDYLELMQSVVDIEQETNWLKRFVRNNNKNRSPLRHLLFLQFLGIDVEELYKTNSTTGKQTIVHNRTPKFDIEERREKWLTIIKDNPGANRSELKQIGKGLHTWIYVNDRDWYDHVTPRVKTRKQKKDSIDWKKRDEECLGLAKSAVGKLLRAEGKPIRLMPSTIRRTIGVTRWFNHAKLQKTRQYIEEITETIESYRVRKIKWAIEEMINQGEKLTVYKVQLKAGFGGGNKEIRETIASVLREYK
ncbi:TnsD family Tn7-like transposition protein [Peribacillus asahii]|uniref:TnsD family Tn7-like transposition protein n=1 Tax=Peribacillus asahii TaxID=228899 RepID=UPI002079977C|nr:TnsD family Tn7-like transposition protein [Peribacillus asahii]USK60403.1 TnsD family transposase [Peribacillus asahii]